MEWLWDFLERFIGPPTSSSGVYSMDQVMQSESVHFLLSAVWGWLVFLLIWTILSYTKLKWSDRYIFRFSLVCGLCASVTVHILIDGFTTLG